MMLTASEVEVGGRSSGTSGRLRLGGILGGTAALALVVLLLGWGLSAMQWTILETNNNLIDAVTTHKFQTETAAYSIPQGVRRFYPVSVSFHAPSTIYRYGISCGIEVNISACTLPMPVSNSSTTIQDYVVFTVSNPNGSAIILWYSSPLGNVTQICGDIPEVTCQYAPTPDGTGTGPFLNFYQAISPGNYSVHILSTQCSPTYDYCSTTTATGTVTLAVSTITYSRPYYAAGLVTVAIAGVAIAASIAFITITAYRVLTDRRRRGR